MLKALKYVLFVLTVALSFHAYATILVDGYNPFEAGAAGLSLFTGIWALVLLLLVRFLGREENEAE